MNNNRNKNSEIFICLVGTNKNISSQLSSKGFLVHEYGRNTIPKLDFSSENIHDMIKEIIDKENANNYIILSGFLQAKKITDQSKEEITKSFFINSIGPTLFAESVLNKKPKARIILIGSESGIKGSFDLTYALSKSSLRMYVKQRRVGINQQLLLISPSTIEDLGMTERRNDVERLDQYIKNHPKKRFINSMELTDLIVNIFKSTKYLTNEEICIDGGKFSQME